MTPEPNSFLGAYAYTVDDKGRVNIPARFRKILHPANSKTFVISKAIGDDKCLIAMPAEEWARIEENLKSNLNMLIPQHRQFQRSLTRYATYVKYDGQGRITIPQTLLELVGIEKDVVIIGTLKQLEIWDPKLLEKTTSEQGDLTDDDLKELAEKIVL